MEQTVPTPPRPPRKTNITRVIAATVVWLVVGAVLSTVTAWVAVWRADHLDSERNPGVGGLARSVFPGGVISVNATERGWLSVTRAGWPLHALQGWIEEAEERGAIVPREDGLIWLPQLKRLSVSNKPTEMCVMNLRRPFGFPVLPHWPGFALNTLFYAAIAWLLWRIPILIRRHRRRIRGLCLHCAYNRAGLAPNSPCPECGHAPPSPSISAAS